MSAYRLSSVGFAVQGNFCENLCGFLLPALRRQGAVSARFRPVGRAGRSRHFRFSSVYGCGDCVPTFGNRFLSIAVWPRRVNPNIEYSGGRGDGTMKEVPEKTLSKLLMPAVPVWGSSPSAANGEEKRKEGSKEGIDTVKARAPVRRKTETETACRN